MRSTTPGLLLLATLAACGEPVPAPPAGDPWSPEVAATTPSGPAVPLRASRSPRDAFRTTGTIAYRQTVSGTTGPVRRPADRRVDGVVDLRVRTEGVAGGPLTTVVDGRLETVDRSPGAGDRRRVAPLTLRFEHDGKGGAVHRTIRLEAPADVKDALEVLQAAWTDRFRLPATEVRVGEAFPPTDVLDLDEALRRPLYFLFVRRAQQGDPVGAPIEGSAWVEARETFGGTEVLRTRFAAVHAYEGDTDVPPPTKDNVRIGWRGVVEGVVRVAVDGGWARTFDMARRRRVSYRTHDLDYVVEVEGRAALESVREGP